MSYDLGIADRDFNMTFNVSKVFYDHIPDTGKGGGLRELAGETGRSAATILGDAFTRLNRTRHNLWQLNAVGEPEMSRRYDAPNGWGSLIGAIIFLGEVMAACHANPRHKVWLSL